MTVGDDDDDKREGSLQEGTVPFLCVKLDNHVDFFLAFMPPLFPLILTEYSNILSFYRGGVSGIDHTTTTTSNHRNNPVKQINITMTYKTQTEKH